MPATPRLRRQATDDWDQLRLLVSSPEQATYELLRPIVLFGQDTGTRERETGVPARTLRRKVARFAATGMRSLFAPDDPPVDGYPEASEDGMTFVDDGSRVVITVRDPAGAVVQQFPDTSGRPVTGTRMGPGAPGFPEGADALGTPTT